jgi:hypothetical protein
MLDVVKFFKLRRQTLSDFSMWLKDTVGILLRGHRHPRNFPTWLSDTFGIVEHRSTFSGKVWLTSDKLDMPSEYNPVNLIVWS